MSEPALSGNHLTDLTPTHPSDAHVHNIDAPPTIEDQILDDISPSTITVNGHIDNYQEGPPSKKRKIVEDEHQKSSPRARSPPWKKITADGPTTFLENGRRRSGRTNVVPLEQQPQLRKRQTRAAYDKLTDKAARPSYNTSKAKQNNDAPLRQKDAPAGTGIRRGPGRPPKIRTEQEKAPPPKVNSPRVSRRSDSRIERPQSPVSLRERPPRASKIHKSPVTHRQKSPSPPLTLQKVKFRVALPQPSILTPANVPPPKKYANFRDFLDNDPLEPFTGQDSLTHEQIVREALARRRIYEARKSGQAIGDDALKTLPSKQNEPPKYYSHHDHLLGHINHFRHLLKVESRDHRRKAEQIAHEAKRYVEEKKKKGRVKTAEELLQEHIESTRHRYRYVIKDLDRLWLAVLAEVNAIRQRQFEEEQQVKIKNHLNRVLERTDEMLTRREGSEMTSDVESSESGTELHTEGESDDSNSEVMSASSSDTESVIEPEDPDETLSAEQLRAKYEDLPELNVTEELEVSELDGVGSGSAEEDSDPDIEMDSEFDSDEDDDPSSEGAESVNEGSGDESEEGGLLSLFFSKKEVAAMKIQTPDNDSDHASPELRSEDAQAQLLLQTESEPDDVEMANHHESELEQSRPTRSITNVIDTDGATSVAGQTSIIQSGDYDAQLNRKSITGSSPPDGIPNGIASQDLSFRTSPETSATKQSEPDSVSSFDPQPEVSTPCTQADDKPNIRTPVPHLLRGTLREYQHEGLDWLANLYANGRSGILADEMGLGKTIQSIALLAHLATHYEVWGPHLIVVPTSVMLNWEMEFKKFLPGFKILTYYGNLEERKQKRRGWMADDSFNVCITSYQLVLQDANSFKRRRWHYMILDEAHNIKNFRSERWQTMMTFNTRARLLLTGTPLQNNLTELWSLLFFLHYGQEGENDNEAFAGLKEWSEWFKRPVESILEHGRQVLDQEDKEQVAKLHKVIRPFLLRRLKADVEKQMPAKYEHVEMCRLSKRQRQLYDGFMSRAQTKETLASGNYLSIINALMQLRKVCNHPDLFETRPINTSFAMPKSVITQCEIQDLLLRRKLFNNNPLDEVDLDFLQLVPISNEKVSLIENIETVRRHAYHPFKVLRDKQSSRVKRHAVPTGWKRVDILTSLENIGRNARLQDIDRTMYYEAYRHHQRPIYGRGLLEKLTFRTKYSQLSQISETQSRHRTWDRSDPVAFTELVRSIQTRSLEMEPLVQQYACITPAVTATDLSTAYVTELGTTMIRQHVAPLLDPFHTARMKLSIAFPDKRLLQYDCGKLQRLDRLLRQLQSGGHRALIFTQMTKVLDILEQFLNIHGHRYLRLDGATKIEQRQILTDRFNNDPRILCFILSSRSGGLGINLTGADTVIFYDLDWNPAMDRQCTDRAHRIGQTRDVHIYRFVSEHTIESNILRKANQKQMLDDVVIQEGDFTTDYMNKLTYHDMLDDQAEDDVAGAAIDRVLGNDKSAVAAFEQAEDQEDVSAAKVAAKEVQHADDGDFEDKAVATPNTGDLGTPGPFGATNTAIAEADDDGIHHIDDYLMKIQTFLLKDVPLALPRDKSKRGRKRVDDHRKHRPR